MVNHIPELIDPIIFARQGENLRGEYAVKQMKRLTANLNDSSGIGIVNFSLTFAQRENAHIATGEFKTDVTMICQRCLKPIKVSIDGEIYLEFITGETEEGTLRDEGFETVSVLNGSLSLLELIEDEVLLGMPFVPKHDQKNCSGTTVVENLQEPTRPNPFAVLAKLKNNQGL